jgi:mono/diheme cytochrome c family protein
MKRFLIVPAFAALAATGVSLAGAGGSPDEAAIRAGRKLAVTICIVCHAISPDQSFQSALGEVIPSFEEIANRPYSTVDSLREAMSVARWDNHAMAAMLLPMSRISDAERAQVAAYIMSLREHR